MLEASLSLLWSTDSSVPLLMSSIRVTFFDKKSYRRLGLHTVTVIFSAESAIVGSTAHSMLNLTSMRILTAPSSTMSPFARAHRNYYIASFREHRPPGRHDSLLMKLSGARAEIDPLSHSSPQHSTIQISNFPLFSSCVTTTTTKHQPSA